jgi:hypothetical protein
VNKKVKRLNLNREVLRTVDPSELPKVAGGFGSSSENCSTLCTSGHSDGGHSFCLCPFCQTVPPVNGC